MSCILYCEKCESYISTDSEIFKEYNDKKFVCNKCLEKNDEQEIIIDSRMFIDKRKPEPEIPEIKNKRRRKSDIKKLD